MAQLICKAMIRRVLIHQVLKITLMAGALTVSSVPIAPFQAIASITPLSRVELKQARAGQRLPGSVSRRARRALSRFLNVPRRQINVISYNQQIWSDSCLELGPLNNEPCRRETVQGWRVVVSNGDRNWTYRSDRSGRRLRIESQGNSLTRVNLPDSVFTAVVEDAQKRSLRPTSAIRLIWAEERNWSDSCLGLTNPEVVCTAVVTPGWLIGVEVDQQRWIYRTDNAGTVVRPEAQSAEGALPGIISQLVLQDARTQTTDSVRIIQYEPREWPDGCLGLPEAGEFCTQALVPGWRVVIESNTRQRWAYRTDSTGSTVRLERTRQRVPIPGLPR